MTMKDQIEMPDEIMIARQGLEYICPAWSKDEHATKYIRADLAQSVEKPVDKDYRQLAADIFALTSRVKDNGLDWFLSETEEIIRTALTHHTELKKAAEGLVGALQYVLKEYKQVRIDCNYLQIEPASIADGYKSLSTYRKAVG